jgi:hypothetical protein
MKNLSYLPSQLAKLFDIDWAKTQIVGIAEQLALKDFDAMIAGGAIVRTLLGLDINKADVDIYAQSTTALSLMKKFYAGKYGIEETKFACNFVIKQGIRKTKVQIITKEAPSPAKVTISKFDFMHCMFAFTPKGDLITTTDEAVIALARKKIILNNVVDPNRSICRAIKYKELGFDADEALVKLAACNILKENSLLVDGVLSTDVVEDTWKKVVTESLY